MADALGLGPSGVTLEGSSPSSDTNWILGIMKAGRKSFVNISGLSVLLLGSLIA